jgi:peptide/nickel transport system substrate-binding protein
MRQAANTAIDRDGIVKLLNGTAEPATGLYPENHPVFGKPANHYAFDPAKSQALLKEAGYTGPVKGQGHDLDQRLWADAAVADERIPAAEHA